MNAQIRRLEKLLDTTDDKREQERIQKLIDRATADAQKANAAARKMAREIAKVEKHKRDMETQRKIVAGAIALSHMEHDEDFADQMTRLIRRYAEKRHWFHYPEIFTPEEIETATAEVETTRKQTTAARAKKRLEDIAHETAMGQAAGNQS